MTNSAHIRKYLSCESSKYNRLFAKNHKQEDYSMYLACEEVTSHTKNIDEFTKYLTTEGMEIIEADKELTRLMKRSSIFNDKENAVLNETYMKYHALAKVVLKSCEFVLKLKGKKQF